MPDYFYYVRGKALAGFHDLSIFRELARHLRRARSARPNQEKVRCPSITKPTK